MLGFGFCGIGEGEGSRGQVGNGGMWWVEVGLQYATWLQWFKSTKQLR